MHYEQEFFLVFWFSLFLCFFCFFWFFSFLCFLYFFWLFQGRASLRTLLRRAGVFCVFLRFMAFRYKYPLRAREVNGLNSAECLCAMFGTLSL